VPDAAPGDGSHGSHRKDWSNRAFLRTACRYAGPCTLSGVWRPLPTSPAAGAILRKVRHRAAPLR